MAVAVVAGVSLVSVSTASAAADPCVTGNAIACENSKPGTDPSEWDVQGAGDTSIQGYATTMSVNPGDTVKFKIKAAAAYTVDIYRLGYYGGDGARRQASTWTVSNPVVQPACVSDASTFNYDCGTWSVSTSWAVPSAAVSGIYIAKLRMGDDSSHITFVVRADSSHSDVVFKTSDATWQAYNVYGGADFYEAPNSLTQSQARAFKISYNRPFATRDANAGRDFLFSNEYPTLRFLERNGVDVSYTTDMDVSAGTTTLTNHKVFMSVGHDEYWTLPERNNVESARDAGVSMMFLSGNEAYWHTRLEPSIDGSSTPNRTLVCYKDSWEGTKYDPGEGSPTWRDYMEAAPNGSRPENALTGTLYMSNDTDLPITVPAAMGKARLWRNTTVATLAAGASATLAPHSIGYESDEDLDNGFRPAGLMQLSLTTGATAQKVQNQAGTQVAPGTTTHSLTLYRAASGALVFGAGTINWGWGLDQVHDGDNSNAADPRMQQATLNMLSDMDVQPTTLMTGLVMPSASVDTQAPSVTVTSPSAGSSLANGSLVVVSGTATDNGGGVVTTVEVSLDGGKTYHRAAGTTTWTYSGVISGAGAGAIKVRASDDSANLGAPTSQNVTVTCPCSLFGQQVPNSPTTNDSASLELGVKFKASADGFISGIRFYKGTGNTGTHTGTLWASSGAALASTTFTNETASGWQTVTFSSAIPVTAGTTYVASYYAPNGHYAGDSNFFTTTDYQASPLSAPGRPSGVGNGVFASGHSFPTNSYNDSNYWVDVLYSRDDSTPPTVSTTTPLPNASSVSPTVKPSAVFAGTVDAGSVTMTVSDAQGNAVPGTTSFDTSTRAARFTPLSALSHGAKYTASVIATSASGVAMPSAYAWSFTVATTDPLPGICPCSIWSDSDLPATTSTDDTSSVELGVRWTADVDGQVTGVRFYKGALNVGSHTGSLWTASGGQLATVTFGSETSTGWQTAYFTAPVDVTAGTTYIVSYRAPNGGYAATNGGLSSAVDSPPLHAVSGGGVFTYGSGAPLNPSTTNYWIDVVYVATDAAPTVTNTSPGDGATSVSTASAVTATLSGKIQDGSAHLALKTASGETVDGATAWSATSHTVTFTPVSPLTAGTTYVATVSGAVALSGNVMSQYQFSFTAAGVNACPCSLFDTTAVPATVDSGDNGGVELGVSFSPTVDGQITGVRFYKSSANTGTHVGNLWNSNGQLLATGTFTGESSGGWQTLTFPGAVAVTGGTTYVGSYYAPNGHYSATSQFFTSAWSNGPLTAGTSNGLYAYGSSSNFPTHSFGATNYWVDPIFKSGSPADTTPPTVSSASPIDGSTSQAASTAPSVTFSEAVDTSTLSFTVKSAAGTVVSGATAYDGSSRTATFMPAAPLTRGTKYVISVTASDGSGNAMTSPKTWAFTVAQPDPVVGTCPCSLWTDNTQPGILSDTDAVSVELGTAFRTDTAGSITGVRFYKGPENTGSHSVSLWSSDGSRLATGTATSESSQGWQTATFDRAVNVTPNTTYVVSYLAPNGRYSAVLSGLDSALDVGPLHTQEGAGRYVYGTGFPTATSRTSYMVDPVFSTSSVPDDVRPPSISDVNVTTDGSKATITWTTDESSTSSVSYGTSSSLGSTATGSTGTSHSVTITGLTSGATYSYRVTSADASGNSASSPVTSASPATFTAPDTVAPTISGITVTGSGSSRTITWTTDESGTSSVAYGTSATSLSSSATGSTGTSHSVTLTGLSDGTTYYYRVTSADAAGNSRTSPASSSDPSSFSTTDTTPPTISTVTASGSGTSAVVTWATNESATSSVAYGTSATSLTSTATGASGTSHSVALSGLTPNTRYYYRVTSADAAGNSATSPATGSGAAQYVPTVSAINQTSVSDFSTGTGGYVADTSGGEIIATPTTGYEFAGTAVPSGLSSTALATGGTSTVNSNVVKVSGSQLAPSATLSSGVNLTVAATMGAGHIIALAQTNGATSGARAAFVMSSTGALSVVVNDGLFNNKTIAISGTYTGAPHQYRIDWSSSTATFYIDGAQKASNAFTPLVKLKPMLIDPTVDSNPLSVDWMRTGPYATTSTFVSGVIDAGATVAWDTLTRDVTAPSGTTVTIQVRSGSTATPGTGWTAWSTVSATTNSITRSARYLQYQVVSTTSGTRFVYPQTNSVSIAFHVP